MPDYVVMVDSTALFKKRLDKFWSKQTIYFNFEAKLEGTGSYCDLEEDVDKEAKRLQQYIPLIHLSIKQDMQ